MDMRHAERYKQEDVQQCFQTIFTIVVIPVNKGNQVETSVCNCIHAENTFDDRRKRTEQNQKNTHEETCLTDYCACTSAIPSKGHKNIKDCCNEQVQ